MLITYDANILPNATPIIINAGGNVANDLSLIMFEPIIPLKKIVIGAAVKEKICAKARTIRFLVNTFYKYIFLIFSK